MISLQYGKQDLSQCMKDELLILAEKINFTITDTEENVGSYCKKRICWDNVKALIMNFQMK